MGKLKGPSLNGPSLQLKIIVLSNYTNDFTVIHLTLEKKAMKTLNCILFAMAIIACSWIFLSRRHA